LSPLVPRNDEKGGSYGYLLWHDTIEFEGQGYTYAFASGNGGNKVVIFHDLPVVVVITATAYGKLHGHLQADRILKKFVLPAVVDRE
jgi:hypothetical protein